ncbi:hypothetical protein ATN84_23350 [Paramesorhizobium deserti]|uniref:ABC transporter substrate-binding protein n=1 Tax=Paramesorhizobium deserti TaxID=1494590 RepID=A0A135HY40_9HYPH|nr:tripartite tricarboxylate transporter substrate binding protein [Paramesorhizobium deserti]KXF78112.1 hypothetical protein ATN84_23350 [Paramesorhizobium deserti]
MMKSLILGLVLTGALSNVALAEDYPTRDIDLVVPFAPGGAVDVTSRLIAATANTFLQGAEIVVSNRAGGGGVIGQSFVAGADPDGYTVLAMTSSVVTNPQLKGAPYKVSDYTPVAAYNLDPEVLVVPANSPFKTAQDLIAAARQAPLNMDVAGIATSHHMAGIALSNATGAKFSYLPAKGFGEQLQAMVGGHVDCGLWAMGEALSHAKSGSIRILAVASDVHDESMPEIPTFEEAGLGIPIWATFRGWAVPADTPEPVVTFLSDLMKKVFEDATYQQKMKEGGYEPTYRGAADFQKIITSYAEQTSTIIEENKMGK